MEHTYYIKGTTYVVRRSFGGEGTLRDLLLRYALGHLK